MAEPLKNQFGPDVPRKIAGMISAVFPQFPAEAFILDALDGYESLELLDRGRKIAAAMRRHLPSRYDEAARILLASLGPRLEKTDKFGMATFLYLPHIYFVAEYGLNHFEASMEAQYELTQRFTAEYSIRAFLVRYPEATLMRLRDWARDPNPHVRRLVSEGTRPRLPWAIRLREFQKDPGPVLALLELLKDDPELYVRRSVANNLNDIGKDHPSVIVETARKWMIDASEERRWLVRHALRSAVKRGDRGALEILGFGEGSTVSIDDLRVTPVPAVIGKSATITVELTNTGNQSQSILVDLRIHFVKGNGRTSPKVFKLKALDIEPGGRMKLTRTISLAEMTTRKHYPGVHGVDVVVNGGVRQSGDFEVVAGAFR